ncbi:MAG: hypothetical protein PF439_03825 [Helicobacteraceae bacterium]|jgi:hypothetical protein|nr:hypothetical protein [Helicobacteraceae bacterium]
MLHRFTFLLLSLAIFLSTNVLASDQNSSATRIEVIITVAGIQETVASIEKSSQQIALLTQQLSNKEDFTSKDHELISALTKALNRNADAINSVAEALPKQFEKAEVGINSMLNVAKVNVQEVVSSSKHDLIDPTLRRIETRLLLLVLVIAAVLFGLLWFGLWKLRAIASIGSETIANITTTVQSLEKVVTKVNESERSAPISGR